MAAKKIIAVVGATGAQGGGLVQAILNDSESPFAARAVTRKPNSEKAQALAKQGAEVVQADLDDLASLKKAFDGCHGAFCVTNFWEHFSAEKEKDQARNLARAAKAAGLQHVIWSTLEDTRTLLPISDDRMPVLQEKYNVPHLDAKGEANQYFLDEGVPTTMLLTSFFWENFIHFGMGPLPGPDGVLAFAMPMGDVKLPGIAVGDIGKAAYGIFREGTAYVGKTVGIAGEHLTGQQMADAFSEAFGKKVQYNAVPADAYRSFGFPGADELGNMFQFKRDFNEEYCGARQLEVTRGLNPDLQNFKEWLAQHKDQIPLKPAS
jgi:uncharacterized protein YbjT (DUF2867 family)